MQMPMPPPTQTVLEQETVTVPLLDLYDLFVRLILAEQGYDPRTENPLLPPPAPRKDRTMPEFEKATTTKRAKRGYRKVTMLLRSSDYAVLAAEAEKETRTPDQQAAHLLQQALASIKHEDQVWGRDNGQPVEQPVESVTEAE